jgi:hypothetical protein
MSEEKVAVEGGVKSLMLEKYAEGAVPGKDLPFEVIEREYDAAGAIVSEKVTHPDGAMAPPTKPRSLRDRLLKR